MASAPPETAATKGARRDGSRVGSLPSLPPVAIEPRRVGPLWPSRRPEASRRPIAGVEALALARAVELAA